MKKLKIDNNNIENTDYFIGTMVFSGSAEKDATLDVVDGQQRLTVITILLSVITSKLVSLGQNELANATFKYIKTTDDYGISRPKLKSQTSYPFFDSYVQSMEKSSLVEPISEEEANIKQTYDFFSKELQEKSLRNKYGFNAKFTYTDILTKIRDQILMLKVISIITGDKDTAYEIFEILNAKGKNLASIDLIKNIIYEKFHGDKNAKDNLIEECWEEVKKILRKRDSNIGMATFYRHYWISKYEKITNVKLYDSFKKHIISDKTTYEQFVKDLKKEAKNYIKIVSPRLEDYESRKEYQWLVESLKAIEKYFGVVQARIFFLALFYIKDNDLISSKEFKKAVKYVENFIFAHSAIMKNQANIYESRFSKLAIQLRKSASKAETNKILEKFLYDAFYDRFPSREEFIEKFATIRFSKGNLSSNVIAKYAVNKISANYAERDIFWDNSTIEHILNENEKDDNTLFIGNLIALESNLNNEADKLSFEEKREIYNKSNYKQVKNFVKENEHFTFENVLKRSKKLGDYYYTKILTNE
jgi:hypothetical protein